MQDLEWTIGFLDLDSENFLLGIYFGAVYSELVDHRLEGRTEEAVCLKGLVAALEKDNNQVKQDVRDHLNQFGKFWRDWDELQDLRTYGREEHGSIKRK